MGCSAECRHQHEQYRTGEHAEGYKRIYRALVGGRGSTIAITEIRKILAEIVRKEVSEGDDEDAVPHEVKVQFVVGAFLTMLTWWLERKPSLAPSEVDRMFRRLVLDGIG